MSRYKVEYKCTYSGGVAYHSEEITAKNQIEAIFLMELACYKLPAEYFDEHGVCIPEKLPSCIEDVHKMSQEKDTIFTVKKL